MMFEFEYLTEEDILDVCASVYGQDMDSWTEGQLTVAAELCNAVA